MDDAAMPSPSGVLRPARSELILGGQKSGKTRRAESLAQAWLAQSPLHRAVYVATAQAWDDEMRSRIACHQRDRAARVSAMQTVEAPVAMAQALMTHSRADTLVVVDCLTLWLTNLLMPAAKADFSEEKVPERRMEYADAAIDSIALCAGPVVLVSNEIGWGVVPMGQEVRQFVDALGQLNQRAAQVCARVTLMAAGVPLVLKEAA